MVRCLVGRGIGHAVGLNGLDAHLGKILPVSLQLLVLLLPLQVEDQDLVAAAFAEYFGSNLGAGRLGHGSGVAGDCEHIAELDRLGLGVGNHTLNFDYVAWSDSILLTTGANNRVHKPSSAAPAAPVRSCIPKNSSGGNFCTAVRSSPKVNRASVWLHGNRQESPN